MPNDASAEHRDWGPLEGAYQRAVRASAEAVFPPSSIGAPDWQQTALEPRVRRYVDALPPQQRKLVKLMFIGVEVGALVLSPGLRFFSRRPLAVRTANLARWRASRILPMRLLGEALKATLQMIYLADPAVMRYIGEYKTWALPGDPWDVDIRPAPTVEAAGDA